LLFSTNIRREFSAIARGTGDGAWEYVLENGWDSGAAYDWTGRRLLVVANVDGYTRAWLHEPETLEQRQELRLPGDGVAGGFRFSHDGRYLSYSFSSALIPGDAWVEDLDTGERRRLTASPCEVDPATFVAPTLERFASHDGVEVPVYVYRPLRGTGTSPVVAYLHGGPESQFRPSFSPLVQYLVARGYAVVAPNIRGSTGYGRTYEHLDDGRKRLDAVADLAAMHAWIAASDDLDPERVALYGGSYGGYLVLAGLTMQPDLWAAGIDVVGISSLVTFLENTADWRRRFREREYGSLEADRDFLLEASPMSHIDAIRAPLFIIHGANDPRVPLGEAEQIHAIVRDKGLPTELLVYEDEGHGLAKLRNRLDAYPRVAAFLDEVLGVA
jgi:dipeptidyl aminopeptidase/acylaminoacyl peptidase